MLCSASSWRWGWLKLSHCGRTHSLCFPSQQQTDSNRHVSACTEEESGRQPVNVTAISSPYCLNNFDWVSRWHSAEDLPVGWAFPGDISHHGVWQLPSFSEFVRQTDRQNEHIGLWFVWKPGRVRGRRPTRSPRSVAPSVRAAAHSWTNTYSIHHSHHQCLFPPRKSHHVIDSTHTQTHARTHCCHCRSICLCHSRPPANIWHLTANIKKRKPLCHWQKVLSVCVFVCV